MKTKLLFLCLSITFINYAQSPINEFTSADFSEYAIVTSTIDQSATGAGLTWNFTSLTDTGSTNDDTIVAPTAGELATYPGTTDVFTITTSPSASTSQIFIKDDAGEISLTGLAQGDILLNYNTDNALIGTFPLTYGYSNSDAVSGTYDYPSSPTPIDNRTFTGTIDTTVDAHGTLNMNDVGAGATSSNVTRLKTIQNLNISGTIIINPIFPPVPISGTVIITTHNYYKSDGDLVFRTIETNISVPAAGINDNDIIIESLIDSVLDIEDQNSISYDLNISPNPVENELQINLLNNQVILSIQIFDIQGREVLSQNGNSPSIAVDKLNTGVYYASIMTENGKTTQKFIKK